jgi:hypothetical protein
MGGLFGKIVGSRRLEMSVEQLKTKSTSQLAELGRKGDAINRLKVERDALKVEIVALKTQVEAAAYSTEMGTQASLDWLGIADCSCHQINPYFAGIHNSNFENSSRARSAIDRVSR